MQFCRINARPQDTFLAKKLISEFNFLYFCCLYDFVLLDYQTRQQLNAHQQVSFIIINVKFPRNFWPTNQDQDQDQERDFLSMEYPAMPHVI